MKHASRDTIAGLGRFLDRIRRDGLKERSPGVFYRKSRPFLHFHEDPAALFADLVHGADFTRHPINTRAEQDALLSEVEKALAATKPPAST